MYVSTYRSLLPFAHCLWLFLSGNSQSSSLSWSPSIDPGIESIENEDSAACNDAICFFTSQRKDFLPVTRMADQEPAPPGAGAEEELQPPGMEEEAPSAKIEEPAAIEPAPAAAPAAAPAVSAPVPPPVSAPVATPVSAPQAPPATSEPAAVIPTSAPPVAAVSAAPVSAPVAAPAPAAAPAASTQYAAQYAQYGYGAYPGYAPSMPVAGYGYDPAAYYYGGYYGHPAQTGNASSR